MPQRATGAGRGERNSPGFAVYRRNTEDTAHEAFAVQVAETGTVAGAGRITALHTFLDPTLFRAFDLPERLPTSA